MAQCDELLGAVLNNMQSTFLAFFTLTRTKPSMCKVIHRWTSALKRRFRQSKSVLFAFLRGRALYLRYSGPQQENGRPIPMCHSFISRLVARRRKCGMRGVNPKSVAWRRKVCSIQYTERRSIIQGLMMDHVRQDSARSVPFWSVRTDGDLTKKPRCLHRLMNHVASKLSE